MEPIHKPRKFFKTIIIITGVLLAGLTIFIFVRANEMLVKDMESYELLKPGPVIRKNKINNRLNELEIVYKNLNEENKTKFETHYYEIVTAGKDLINQFNEWENLVESNKPELFKRLNTAELGLLFMELESNYGDYRESLGSLTYLLKKALESEE